MAVIFIVGGNQNARRKPHTCQSHCPIVVSSAPIRVEESYTPAFVVIDRNCICSCVECVATMRSRKRRLYTKLTNATSRKNTILVINDISFFGQDFCLWFASIPDLTMSSTGRALCKFMILSKYMPHRPYFIE
jgi:hypothetical protein